ncbi:MAG: DUF3617 domain-containing protein [Syntrophaceae bacterium]|nr:DUF3617 domain-containing protein [Syntrophaceae bacterium]
MKKTLIIFAVFLSMLWTAGAFAELKEGLWEVTTQVEIKGMPQQMPPTTFRQCITKNDPVPQNKDQNKDKNYECKTINRKVSGNTISYTMECKGKEGETKVSGTTTYTDNSMNGTSTSNIKIKGQPEMQMTSKIRGKYIGPCPK